MRPPVQQAQNAVWRSRGLSFGSRSLPEETAVALTYDGSSYAVMMATPQDLEDFAVGFSLTEGIIGAASDIDSIDVVEGEDGIELRMWLSRPRADALRDRRRHLAGPTGCGLCGIESLSEAMRQPAMVSDDSCFSPDQVMAAVESIASGQVLHRQTHAVHAAAFWTVADGLVDLREDVGRHNALDKLIGRLNRNGNTGGSGICVLSSRVSVEMVQKAAAAGFPVIVAISAPTALAVRLATAAGITLAAVARRDGFEIFTNPQRIVRSEASHVA